MNWIMAWQRCVVWCGVLVSTQCSSLISQHKITTRRLMCVFFYILTNAFNICIRENKRVSGRCVGLVAFIRWKLRNIRMFLVVAEAICEVFNNKTIYLSSLKDSIVDFRQIQITFLSLQEGRIRKLHKLGNYFKVVKQWNIF